MKFGIPLLSLFLFASARAQDTATLSNFERFSSAKGKMFRFESNEAGSTKEVTVYATRVTDMESGEFADGLEIDYKTGTFLSPTFYHATLIFDKDEAPSLAKALQYFKRQVAAGKPKSELSYTFISKENIVFNLSYARSAVGWQVELHKEYWYSKIPVPGTQIYVRNKDILDLADYIQKATTMSPITTYYGH